MSDFQKAVAVISSVPTFSDLDTSILKSIAAKALRRSIAAGQVLFLEGESCAGLHIVEQGWLKSMKTSSAGREQVVRFVGPGDTFNDAGTFAGVKNQATVTALESSTVWVISCKSLQELIHSHASLAHVIARNMAQRVIHLMNMVEDLSLRPVLARLVRTLLEHSTNKSRRF